MKMSFLAFPGADEVVKIIVTPVSDSFLPCFVALIREVYDLAADRDALFLK